MIVCVCHRVSDREIARSVRAGLDFDGIQFELGVATQCGQCEGCVRDIVAQCSASHKIAAVHRDTPAQVIQIAQAIQDNKAWKGSRALVAA